MLAPMAVLSGVLAPIVGKLIDRINPRYFATTGLVLFALSLFWYSRMLTPDVSIWWLLIPSCTPRHRDVGRLGTDLDHRHPQPAAEPGGSRIRRVQHDASDRRGAR